MTIHGIDIHVHVMYMYICIIARFNTLYMHLHLSPLSLSLSLSLANFGVGTDLAKNLKTNTIPITTHFTWGTTLVGPHKQILFITKINVLL